MFDLLALTTFFGWMTVINFAFLLVVTVALIFCKGFIMPIHKKLLDLPEEDLSKMYVWYMAQYKIAIFIFCFVPYLALKVMAA